MANQNDTTPIFLFLIGFWTVLTALSSVFYPLLHEELTRTSISDFKPTSIDETEPESFWDGLITGVFDTIERIPIIKGVIPILKIATFQYTDQVPTTLVIFLDASMILSGFVIISILKK